MNELPSIMLKCNCSAEVIEFQYNKEDKEYYVAIWKLGHDNRLSWPERFRWIWKILQTGNLWADSLILPIESKNKLLEWLKNNE